MTKLGKLEKRLPDVDPVDPCWIETLRDTAKGEDEESLREAVKGFHLEVLRTLTAAELRLGRAYGLGHALADTCLRPTNVASFQEAFGVRLIAVKDWLADLASSFPPHSSRAVVLSLRTWEAWAANPRLDKERIEWKRDGSGVRDALRRQGELWRDLLAGDKDGLDMLDTTHYLQAASSLVGSLRSTVWRFLKALGWLLVGAVLALLGGIALLLFTDTLGQVAGAVLTALGALGITGAGVRTHLGKVTAQLQSWLWGAELDLAIAQAVLIGPAGWGMKVADVAVPATGPAPKVAANMTVLHEFRGAAARGKSKEIRKLLAADAKFEVDHGKPLRGRDAIVEWVLRTEPPPETTEPDEVEAIGTGILIVHRPDGAELWRIQEGKVRRWASYTTVDEARTAAEGKGG